MVVVFGSNQYKILNYGMTDTELDVYIPQEAANKDTLAKQAINQLEVSLKNDDGSIIKTVLNFTTLKNNEIKELPIATEGGNVNCYKLTLTRGTELAADVLKNKANIEYIAAMNDVEL